MFNFFKKNKEVKNAFDAKVEITEVVLRDAHQSLLATRLRIDDILPIAEKLDKIGYWSVESWGGATFDSCIRYLGEDPWERIRKIKEVMPNTRQQMLLRGQNLLGYRHYADDVVRKFIDRSHDNGVDVFRIFDAMNDVRNLKTAIDQTIKIDAHAQGTISYTTSPVHTIDLWIDLAKQIEDMGAHSLCIKDMAGLLTPYDAYDLVSKLKAEIHIPIQLHAHATTGLSTATIIKAVEAGVDRVDTAIGSMSGTYGHSATNAIVAILNDSHRSTELNMEKLEEIDAYFRKVRTKYASFEGSLKGVDSRILLSQVPGGMLTNMENQLKEQNALDKFDEVLAEIPRVRKDLGYIPLVTPTSQIVGTQSVLNVLTGERYKTITKEAQGVLKGEYGATPTPVDAALQARVLEAGETPITARPADTIVPELENLEIELDKLVAEKSINLAADKIDDLLTYALFPQVGITFLVNRTNPDFFEAAPVEVSATSTQENDDGTYTVSFKGKSYSVQVSAGGNITAMKATGATSQEVPVKEKVIAETDPSEVEEVLAPLAGNIWKIEVEPHQQVSQGDVLIILEAMKMETEVRAAKDGVVTDIFIKEGASVRVGDKLLTIG